MGAALSQKVLRIDITRGRRCGRPAKRGSQNVGLAKHAAQVRSWQTVKCRMYGETVTKLYKALLATYLPVRSMSRVVLVDDDYDSIREDQHGFSESADGCFS